MTKLSLLFVAICAAALVTGCPHSEKRAVEATPTPDVTLRSRMEQQQKAIQRAAEERRKEQSNSGTSADHSPSPTP